MLPIQQKISEVNCRKASNRDIEFIVIHYVGKVSSAENNAVYYARETLKKSCHYFVDEKSIWQSIRDEDIAWHCGISTGIYKCRCRNDISIGIELCCKADKNGKLYFLDETIKNAVDLTKHLMAKYSIDVNHVIRHHDVVDTPCPAPFVENESAWQDFKNRLVAEEVTEEVEEEEVRYSNIDEVPEWGRETIKKLVELEIIKGTDDKNLNLTEDMVRMFVALDRARIFD